jgi:hypothetical protein
MPIHRVVRFWWAATAVMISLLLVGCGGGDEATLPSAPSVQVDSTADTSVRDGVVTLREALLLATGGLPAQGLDVNEADNVSGVPGAGSDDVITFDHAIFPPTEPSIIALASTLPALSSGGDTIDAAGAGVMVGGGSRAFDCLVITSARNTVSGLQVRECKIGVLLGAGATENTIGGPSEGQGNVLAANETGLRIDQGAGGNFVEGNRVGADRPGATAADGNEIGVFVGGRENFIDARNVISGNERVGMTVAGRGNMVLGNYIGTDPSGLVAVPNGIEGIWVAGQGNTVGGSTAFHRNVISGNGLFGINVSGPGATGNVVKGNYIGVDVTGQKGLGNRNGVGVSFGAQDNVIGGVEPGEGNFISGNSVGVLVRDAGTTGNVFQGNRIGMGIEGGQLLPNGIGISILGGAQGNAIGGTAEGEANFITDNAIGVLIGGESTTGHTIRGNSIHSNSGAGIEIRDGAQRNAIGGTAEGEANSITENAIGVVIDGDSTTGHAIRGNSIHSNSGPGIEIRDGGNGGLPPPVISRIDPVAGTACAGCTVDIYSDDADEGQIYEGSALAGPDGAFEADIEPDGPNVTATATDPNGSTSPFSRPLAVPP